MLFRTFRRNLIFGMLFVLSAACAQGQTPLPIYTDRLVNGFQDWSWTTRNLANTVPVYSGAKSIQVTANTWEAVSFHHADFDSRLYSDLEFWANGGATGGQRLQVKAEFGTNSGPAVAIAALPTNTWQRFSVPLSALGVANKSNLNRLTIQLASGGTSGTFYLDQIQLTALPAPALVHLGVNATQALRSVDPRWFSVNTAIWDSNFDTAETVSMMNDIGARMLRFPGGSLSDEYHWAINKTSTNTWQWATSFANFVHVATNVGAQAMITVNYGTGTPAEAAAWVRHSNVTNHFGFRYWEIGNEIYGDWEVDSNSFPHDPYTYAIRATNFIAQMKAADPTINIGIVVAAGENSFSNAYTLNHPAINPRTGTTNYGWTAILLATLRQFGVTPDFVSHHVYPEYTAQESDPLLLQSTVNWARDAADLRQQITDYFGPAGTNIELLVTENNSNAGDQGKQSTSLVNGLYFADSLGQLMKTEFNAFVWWDFRNGVDYTGNMDSTLYGWKNYGDLGMVSGLNTRHPTFYAAKLMQSLAQPGDTVLGATSDSLLLAGYAARRASGAVTLLVLNKDSITNLTAQIALNGFVPGPDATVRFFGIPQDEVARTNGSAAAQDISVTAFPTANTNFNCQFPSLSMTLFIFIPTAPKLAALPVVNGGERVLQLQGQPDVRYVLQASTNLQNWASITTNTLTGSTLLITNPVTGADVKFWRAVWQP